MKILGISCFYHDAAVALIEDETIKFAIQEERLSRKKNDSGFPLLSIKEALKWCDWDIRDLDCIAFYERPEIKYLRLKEQVLRDWPKSWFLYDKYLPEFKKQKLDIENIIRSKTGFSGEIRLHEHHYSHAAASFFTSAFKEAIILTIDGVGEFDCVGVFIGQKNTIRKVKSIQFPDSLGLLYSVFTNYLGFKVNSGEYKVMGMACYGKPEFFDIILKKVLILHDDGSFHLNRKFFNFSDGKSHGTKALIHLLGIPKRLPESDINEVHFNLAASIQKVLENAVLNMIRHLLKVYGIKNLCLAGGVALNCTLNSRIINECGVVPHIHPAAGDAGGAMGCALSVAAEAQKTTTRFELTPYLGKQFTDKAVLKILKKRKVSFLKPANIFKELAMLIADGNVVAIHHGRDEWGPRALGNRSILADPSNPGMQDHLNARIKFREEFRPFAPVILKEHYTEYFEALKMKESPYMLFTHQILKPKLVPAIKHVDNSGRVQTVSEQQNPELYEIIKEFQKIKGLPVLINTSFNLRGEPIVGSPEDALNTFYESGIDYLALNCFLIKK